jgi:DNA-binding Lrp family transcriptional regulator
MKKLIFFGCSFTAGTGWGANDPKKSLFQEYTVFPPNRDHPDLYVNLCHANIAQFSKLQLINCSRGGDSNTEIFENAVAMLVQQQGEIDTAFCQWTSMPRYNFSAGLALEDTRVRVGQVVYTGLANDGISVEKKYVSELANRLATLHHLHEEIRKVVRYTNILQALARVFGINLYFINGLCPWDLNYFVRVDNASTEAYTTFTKHEILNIESRNNRDILKLYEKIHNDYGQAGGIDPQQWVNLYSSMQSNQIDVNHDQQHPGIKSNQIYFEQIKTFIESQQGN